MKKMLVIDGNSILNRAFYGIRLLTNQEGLYTNAVYGMVTMVSRYLSQIRPDYGAVAFDLKAPTFRHKMYEGYKANRKGMPEELAVQLPYAKECMAKMGLHVVTCEGYEADDILGTLASSCGEEKLHVYVLTGDRDSLQLINPNVSVLLVKTKETLEMTPEAFFSAYGIPPSEFVDVKALMGDSSDNIPGVPGIGEKTALKLIAEHHSIDALYGSLETSGLTEAMKNKLTAGRDLANLSKELAQICLEAPVETDPEAYRYDGIQKAELKELFLRLDFSALIQKFGLDQSTDGAKEEPQPQKSTSSCRTCTLRELKGNPCFLAVKDDAIEIYDGEGIVSLSNEELTSAEWREWSQRTHVVVHDAKLLCRRLLQKNLPVPTIQFDTMLAAYVLDSGKPSVSVSELYVRYLNATLPGDIPESVALSSLYPPLEKEIRALGFESLLYDVEIPLASVLAEMELIGFKVDLNGINQYGAELKEAAAALRERIYCYAGREFNVGSPKQLGSILFEELKLPILKKNKTGYSTDAETLQKLIPYHPIIEEILDYRQVTKLISTYAEGLVKAADETGRVHSVFNQTGTATGRLSSSEPNLQNIPVRTELGRKFRQFFIPEGEDSVLIDADYSQIELRLLAHIANDPDMIGMFLSGEDVHTLTASKVFQVSRDLVTPELRKKAKAVNFGIMYGIGEFSLSEDLSISRAEAKAYIESYFAQFPRIREYLDRIRVEAREKGYVTTFFGRRRYIPEIASTNKNLQHFGERVAMNSPIQGTAADVIKIAMINVSKALKERNLEAKLILQVHDELLIESKESCAEEVKEILVQCMEQAATLSVPLSVDANMGKTWFEAKL